MVRVIYRWRVSPEHFDAFRAEWRRTTNAIHEAVPGACGSFMLRSLEDTSVLLTIATWETREAWAQFWGDRNPEQMRAMRALGERLSVEVLEEIEDHTSR